MIDLKKLEINVLEIQLIIKKCKYQNIKIKTKLKRRINIMLTKINNKEMSEEIQIESENIIAKFKEILNELSN